MSDAEKEKLLMTCSSSSIRREHPSKRIWKTRLQAQSSLWLPKGLSLVVDKSAVLYGGTDITKEVTDALNQSVTAAQSSAASASK